MSAIHGLMAEAKRYKEKRPKQIERLMHVLSEGGPYAHLASLQTPVNLPHQPHVTILGIGEFNARRGMRMCGLGAH